MIHMMQGGSGEKVYFDIPCVTVTWRPAEGYILIEMKAWRGIDPALPRSAPMLSGRRFDWQTDWQS
jgi:hypothetical protein